MTDNSGSVSAPVLQGVVRRARAKKADVKAFVRWALTNNAYETYTPGRMRQVYIDQGGIPLDVSCIRRQRGKWQLVDGELQRLD